MAKDDLGGMSDKELKRLIDQIKKSRKEASLLKDAFDGISSTLFGISGSVFFGDVTKNIEELKRDADVANASLLTMNQEFLNLQQKFVSSKAFDKLRSNIQMTLDPALFNDFEQIASKSFTKVGAKGKQVFKSFDQLDLSDQQRVMEVLQHESMSYLRNMGDTKEAANLLLKVIAKQNGGYVMNNEELTKEHKTSLDILATSDAIASSVTNEANAFANASERYKQAMEEANKIQRKPTFAEGVKKGYEAWQKNFIKDVVTGVFEADTALNEIQRTTGIMVSDLNGIQLAKWSSGLAEFGVNLKDAGELMEKFSDGLSTTNREFLMEGVETVKSFSLALGISADETANIANEILRANGTWDDVYDTVNKTNKASKLLGVNSRNVVRQISKNIEKMRQFGFQGGEQSLSKMAAKAERLRIQVDSIFDVAKRARTIEGSMDMAAQLQLAGGSFSQINPMDLLSAARKGPEELGKILTSMGGDVGRWVKDINGNEKYEFDPIDSDRLGIVAEATGMELNDLQKMIQKNAEDNKKLKIFPDSMFSSAAAISGIENIDKEMAKGALSDLLKIGKNGKILLTGDKKKLEMLSESGIKKYEDINAQTLANYFALNDKENARLEDQAQQNRGLKQTYDAFIASLTQIFTAFQPIIEKVTSGLNWVMSNLGGMGKAITAALIVGVPLIGGALMKVMGGFASQMGTQMAAKMLGSQIGGAGASVASTAASTAGTAKIGSSINLGGIAKLSLALAMVGAAVAGFLFALNKVGGLPSLEMLGKSALPLIKLVGGVAALSYISKGIDTGGLLEMSLAMAIVGAAIIPFAYDMEMFTKVNWTDVLGAFGMMALALGAFIGVGALVLNPIVDTMLIAGALAIAGVGDTLLLASASFLLAGMAFEKLASVNWGNILQMGTVLGGIAPSLLMFSAAALMFANPITLIGMGAMAFTLMGLNAVLTPLSKSLLTAGPSLYSFSEALKTLRQTVKSFDSWDFIEKLSDIEINIDKDDISALADLSKSLPEITINATISDVDDLNSLEGKLPPIKLKGTIEDINNMKDFVIDTSQIKDVINQLSTLGTVRVEVDSSEIDNLSKKSITFRIGIDYSELTKLQEMKIVPRIDTSEIDSRLSNLNFVPKIDISDIQGSLNAMKIIPQIDISDIESKIKNIKIEFDLTNVNTLMGALQKIDVNVDASQALEMINSLDPITLKLDQDQINSLVENLKNTPIQPVIDKMDIENQLASIKFTINPNTKEIEALISRFNTIKLNIDSTELVSQLNNIKSESVTIGLNISNIQDLKSIISEPIMLQVDMLDMDNINNLINKPIPVKLDIQNIDQLNTLLSKPLMLKLNKEELLSLINKPITLTVDLQMEDLNTVLSKPILLGVDTKELTNLIDRPLILKLEPQLDAIDNLMEKTLIIGVNKEELIDLMNSQLVLKVDLQNIDDLNNFINNPMLLKLNIDNIEILTNLISKPLILQVDILDLQSKLNSITPAIDVSGIKNSMKDYKIEIDTSNIYTLMSNLRTMPIQVDTTGLNSSIDRMEQFSFNNLVSSIARVEATIDKIDVSKLDSVKNMSNVSLTTKDESTNILLTKVIEAINELKIAANNSSDQANRKISIDFKMNGRDLQYQILEDTKDMT